MSESVGAPHNNRVNLTVRPCTRLAGLGSAPHLPARWRAQGARPSRPAGYAERSTHKIRGGNFSWVSWKMCADDGVQLTCGQSVDVEFTRGGPRSVPDPELYNIAEERTG